MDWVSIVTSLGFPIAACVAMGIYCKSVVDSYRNDIVQIIKDNWEQISKITQALNDNTDAINELRHYIKESKNEDT